MKPIIQVRGLSKRYRIGARRARYGSLRDSLAGLVRSPLAALRRLREDLDRRFPGPTRHAAAGQQRSR